MRKSRFTEEQVTAILAEHRAGVPTSELYRKHGIAAHTFYDWRKKFEDTDVRSGLATR